MPGSLDSCINSIYEPGHIPASVGTPPVRVIVDYDPDAVEEYSLDYSKHYNSSYLLLLMV